MSKNKLFLKYYNAQPDTQMFLKVVCYLSPEITSTVFVIITFSSAICCTMQWLLCMIVYFKLSRLDEALTCVPLCLSLSYCRYLSNSLCCMRSAWCVVIKSLSRICQRKLWGPTLSFILYSVCTWTMSWWRLLCLRNSVVLYYSDLHCHRFLIFSEKREHVFCLYFWPTNLSVNSQAFPFLARIYMQWIWCLIYHKFVVRLHLFGENDNCCKKSLSAAVNKCWFRELEGKLNLHVTNV